MQFPDPSLQNGRCVAAVNSAAGHQHDASFRSR
jgi:hypothetical protein